MVIEGGVLVKVTDEDILEGGVFVFPEGVTSIGFGAFLDCHSLKYITIKATDEKEFNRVTGLLPVELFSMINQFSVGAESPTYLKALKKINEIKQPLYFNATDEALEVYEKGCNKIVDQALQETEQLIQKK